MLNDLIKEYKQKRIDLKDAQKELNKIKSEYELFNNLTKVKQKELEEIITSIDNEMRGGDKQLTFDRQEIEGVKVFTRLQPKSVIVNDVEALPEQFKRVKYEADKKAIKLALESGESIDCAEFSTEEYKVYCE